MKKSEKDFFSIGNSMFKSEGSSTAKQLERQSSFCPSDKKGSLFAFKAKSGPPEAAGFGQTEAGGFWIEFTVQEPSFGV